ncbi:MAG: type II toxin-antitoxin system RelB/DinJ family antitoxin [Peptococcaceae bacterium]|nr:type II toxin-antitoxin system RelB/DinJ family antitoxin [Peptococcaceae bacterium]
MSKLLQVRLDEKLKDAAERVFSSMGLDMSTAVRMFLTAAVETRSMPFEVKAHLDNAQSPKTFTEPENFLSKEKRREILRSLYGSAKDPTFVEPKDVEYESSRDWGLLD